MEAVIFSETFVNIYQLIWRHLRRLESSNNYVVCIFRLLLPEWRNQSFAGGNKILHITGVGSFCGNRPPRKYVRI
jgi:hypothetical protein